MKQKTILIYHCHFCQIGGVETFLYNWCLNLKNYYDITVLYISGNREQINRLSKIVKMEIYNRDRQYECDIFIRNSVWGEVPRNIISKDKRYLEMRHANYRFLLEKGKLYDQYKKFEKTNEVIGCGEFVSKMSDEVLHDHPITIQNILAPKNKTQKILKLISCTRIDSEKGWNRMVRLMELLRIANIKFQWDIFTNSKVKCDYEEVHLYHQRFDIWDYLANADYTVLLSDSEGLPYTVQESLQYKTPCIVTDIEGCTELIKDGINGYVVPLDMNFDVKKLLKIPKCPEYNNHALEKWLDYLGDGVYIEKEIKKEEERKMKVKATAEYAKRNLKDTGLNRIPKEGEEFEVSGERYEILKGNNKYNAVFVEAVGIIKEPVKVEETETLDDPIVEVAAKKPKTEKAVKKTTKKAK